MSLLSGYLLSYLLIRGVTEGLGAPVIAAKIWVDTVLWLVTFAVQWIFVFGED